MWHRLIPLLFLCLLVSQPARAQEAPPAEGLRGLLSARAYGMGGAWRALGLGAEAGTGNPASLALFERYRIELSGAWDWSQKDALGMLSISDATNPLAAGLTYQLASLGRGSLRRTAHLNTLSLAMPLAPGLLIGGSARYLVLRGTRETQAFTADAGVMLRFGEAFTLGASAHNFVDTGQPELTPYYSLHGGLFAGMLTVAADVRADFITSGTPVLTYNAGLEYLWGQAIPLRAGFGYDGFTRSPQLGVGLGFMGDGGGVDIAYRHDLGGSQGRLLALTLKLQVR